MFKSRDVVLVSWSMAQVVRVMRTCIFTSRKFVSSILLEHLVDIFLVAQIRTRYKKPKSSVRIFSRMFESNMKSSRLAHLNNVVMAVRPVIQESEAMVIAPQTDLTRMVVVVDIITTTNHQPLTLQMQPVLQPLQTMELKLLNTMVQMLILMLNMVGMRHTFNIISSTWQPWLNINSNNRVLQVQVLLHPLMRHHHLHHPVDRYVYCFLTPYIPNRVLF